MVEEDFETRLTKAKEQLFKETVVKASKVLGLPHIPEVKVWDEGCPHSDGSEIAHAHPDFGFICITRSRIREMNMEEIEETAVHETTHMRVVGHGPEFLQTMDDTQLVSWMLTHMHNTDKIELKEIRKSGKNLCNYHLCNKRGKLIKCSYCDYYFCENHIKPKMFLTFRQMSTAREPLRSTLEKEWRRDDGHPDMIYTRIAWEEIDRKNAEKEKKFEEALDRLKEMARVPPPPLDDSKEPLLFKKSSRLKIKREDRTMPQENTSLVLKLRKRDTFWAIVSIITLLIFVILIYYLTKR